MTNINIKANTLEKCRAEIEKSIAVANKAIKDGNLNVYSDTVSALGELEKKYLETQAAIVYDELLKEEKPIIAAIKRYSFDTLKHKEVKDTETHQTIALELTTKERQIDLLKFCRYAKLDTAWQYDVQKFNQLLCLRTARELKIPTARIKEILDTFYIEEQAKKIEMGGTPDSNTQVCKQLQHVIDCIVFDENDKGENAYKCNNHDVAYLLHCYTKVGKSVLKVSVAKHDFLRRLVTNVCYRILTNGVYDLEFKVKSSSATAKATITKPTQDTAEKKTTQVSEKASDKAPKKSTKTKSPKTKKSETVQPVAA